MSAALEALRRLVAADLTDRTSGRPRMRLTALEVQMVMALSDLDAKIDTVKSHSKRQDWQLHDVVRRISLIPNLLRMMLWVLGLLAVVGLYFRTSDESYLWRLIGL